MVWLAVLSLAWAGPENVEAQTSIDASPEVITDYLSDLARVAALFPESCAQRWSFEPPTDGAVVGGEVVYRAGWLRRKLPVRYGEVVPGSYVDPDHPGEKGFVTRFQVEGTDEGATAVTMTTFVAAAVPLVKLYEIKCSPSRDCHLRTLDALSSLAR